MDKKFKYLHNTSPQEFRRNFFKHYLNIHLREQLAEKNHKKSVKCLSYIMNLSKLQWHKKDKKKLIHKMKF